MPKKSASSSQPGSRSVTPVPQANPAMGAFLYSTGRYEQAKPLLESIIRQHPEQLQAHVLLIRTYQKLGNWSSARRECEALLQQRPNHPDLVTELALINAQQGDRKQALNAIVDAINNKETSINNFLQYSSVLVSLDQNRLSARCYREVLKVMPDNHTALVELAGLHPLGLTQNERKKAEAGFDDEENPLLERAELGYILALIDFLEQNNEQALNTAEEANQLMEQVPAQNNKVFHHDKYRGQTRVLIQTFSRQLIHNTRDSGYSGFAPVFLVGLPESGIEMVGRILSSHPSVAVVNGQHYLEQSYRRFIRNKQDPATLTAEQVTRYGEELAAIYRDAGPNADCVVDILPENYRHLGWLQTLLPRARVIHCKRDLRDNFAALYINNLPETNWNRFPEDITLVMEQYLGLMTHWQQNLNLATLGLKFEELFKNPEQWLKTLLDFLQLENGDHCLNFIKAISASDSSKLYLTPFFSELYFIGAWEKFSSLISNYCPRFEVSREELLLQLYAETSEAPTELQAAEHYQKKLSVNQSHKTHNQYAMARLALLRHDYDQAHMLINNAISRHPNRMDLLLLKGDILIEKSDFKRAVINFENALKINPDSWEALNKLSTALIKSNLFLIALQYVERCEQIRPNDVNNIYCLAKTYANLGRFREAEHHYYNVLEKIPNQPDSLSGLAQIATFKGDLKSAKNFIMQDIDSMDINSVAYFQLCIYLIHINEMPKALKYIRKAIAANASDNRYLGILARNAGDKITKKEKLRMLELAQSEKLSPSDKSDLYFGLVKYAEKSKQHEELVKYCEAANQQKLLDLTSKKAQFNIPQYNDYIGDIKNTFSKDFLKRVEHWGIMDQTPIFVVGLPRSGTTLTEQVLASHSKVFGAGELMYLQYTMLELSNRKKSQAVHIHSLCRDVERDDVLLAAADYLSRIREMNPDVLRIVDKMPQHYLHLGWIKTLFPKARIIHCTRDIRDTALSIWQNQLINLNWSCDINDITHVISTYLDLMQYWEKVLTMPIHEVNYEQLLGKPETEIKKLLAFCDLDFEAQCLKPHKHKRMVKTASQLQVREPFYNSSVGRWKEFQDILQPVIELANKNDL